MRLDLLGALAVYCALLGCSTAQSDMMSESYGDDGAGASNPGTTTSTTTTTTTTTTPPPPEEELESSFGAPVATGRYVWVANPDSGRVAYIDGETLQIQIVDAGHRPTYLAAVPDNSEDVAIVLNTASSDATVLRAKEGSLTTLTLPVHNTANGWAVSPNGRWATAWTDARELDNADPLDGFQDLTLLDLSKETSTQLSVGYRPSALQYDVASSRLFAITEDGITVLALDQSEPAVLSHIMLATSPQDDPNTRDVSITPDGAFALVRRENQASIGVFSLDTAQYVDVVLSAPVTDLDLSPSGTIAVAVVREVGEVALLDMSTIFSAPTEFTTVTIPDVVVGSVSLPTDSPSAFLYTNALPVSALTVLDTSQPTPTPRLIGLHAPVKSVLPTPFGKHAVVLHDVLDAGSYSSALSLVPVAAELPSKIQGLNSKPTSVAIAPTGERALLAIGGEKDPPYQMLVAQFPSLKIDLHTLASEPISAGIVVEANSGFVAQKHPDGRITFVDFDDNKIRTLTGFELATQVVNGSTP